MALDRTSSCWHATGIAEALHGRGVSIEFFTHIPERRPARGELAPCYRNIGMPIWGFTGIIYAWGLEPKCRSANLAPTYTIVERVETDSIGLIELGKVLDRAARSGDSATSMAPDQRAPARLMNVAMIAAGMQQAGALPGLRAR